MRATAAPHRVTTPAPEPGHRHTQKAVDNYPHNHLRKPHTASGTEVFRRIAVSSALMFWYGIGIR